MPLINLRDDMRGYNGWTNYETWAVALWMDNVEGANFYWRERAKAAMDRAEADDMFSKIERATLDLAKAIQESHERHAPVAEYGIYTDLLGAALSEVNWHEIASHLMDELSPS